MYTVIIQQRYQTGWGGLYYKHVPCCSEVPLSHQETYKGPLPIPLIRAVSLDPCLAILYLYYENHSILPPEEFEWSPSHLKQLDISQVDFLTTQQLLTKIKQDEVRRLRREDIKPRWRAESEIVTLRTGDVKHSHSCRVEKHSSPSQPAQNLLALFLWLLLKSHFRHWVLLHSNLSWCKAIRLFSSLTLLQITSACLDGHSPLLLWYSSPTSKYSMQVLAGS